MSTLRALAFVSLGAAAACSSGTGPASASLDPTSLVSQMSGSAGQTVAASLSTQAPTPSVPAPTAASCVYAASSQSFVCPSATVNGMTITMSYYLYDVAGHPLSVPSPTTLDAIRTVVDMSGTTTPLGSTPVMGAITMTRHQDQTMSGIQSGSRVINGTGSSTMSGTMTINGASTPMNSTVADTTFNLIPPAVGAKPAFPQGGSQVMDQSTTIGTRAPVTSRMVMTYHPDGTVTASLTSGGVTHNCTLNLASPSTAPTCS